MLRIHSYLLSLPSLRITAGAPLQPLLPLQPLSLHEYVNVAMVEIKNRKKLEAKVWNLNGSNRRRADKAARRDSELGKAREAVKGEGEGVVVGIAVVTHEKGKRVSSIDGARLVEQRLIIAEQRKKVLEIGWATWNKGNPVDEIAVEHVKIKEHLHIHNGDFVPDRRDGESRREVARARRSSSAPFTAFAYGISRTLSLEKACDLLWDAIDSTPDRPVTVVANGPYLSSPALDLGDIEPRPFDLGVLFRGARKDQGAPSTLKDMMKWYDVDYQEEKLYNAGQFGSLLSFPPVEPQLTRRSCSVYRQRRQVYPRCISTAWEEGLIV